LIAIALDTKKGFWLPIHKDMYVPDGQDSFSFDVPKINELTKSSKQLFLDWANQIPTSMTDGLVQLAAFECEDIVSEQTSLGSEDFTEKEKIVSETLSIIERLGSLYEGLLSEKDIDKIDLVKTKFADKKLKNIEMLLNASSDQSANGTIQIEVHYDENDRMWTIFASGCICTGTDNDGNALWSDDLNGATKGRWSGEDIYSLLRNVTAELMEIEQEWRMDKTRRDNYPHDPYAGPDGDEP
jgi:hypothetical protein